MKSSDWQVEILDPLRIELRDTDTRVRGTLLEPMRFRIWSAEKFVRLVVVPKGFQTDLASIPRPLWGIPGFSPFDRIARGAVLHDWLYTHGAKLYYTRADADAILEAAMREDGESWMVRKLVWGAVRVAASGHWNKDKI